MYHNQFLFNVIPINYNIGPISHKADNLSLINLAWFQVWIKTLIICKCGETIDCQSQNNANNQDRIIFNIVDIIVKSNLLSEWTYNLTIMIMKNTNWHSYVINDSSDLHFNKICCSCSEQIDNRQSYQTISWISFISHQRQMRQMRRQSTLQSSWTIRKIFSL